MIHVSKPDVTDLEKKYVNEALDTGWISSQGPHIKKFEKAWAEYNDQEYGVATSSGTTALTVALRALGIGKGDEVIVPDFTMIATAWAVEYVGATPVFVDCADDLNMDVNLIEGHISCRTKAIIPVHIYGRQCNMDEIMRIAYEYNLFVVEDSAEAHGVKPVGDIACYSLFANKILSSGEGGVCLTKSERLAKQMNHIKAMAFDEDHTFLHKKLGYNFRMTNLAGAFALAQVERIDEILAKRKQIEEWYDKHIPTVNQMPKRDVLWMYDVQARNAGALRKKLADNGVETRVFFKPMSDQPMFKEHRLDSNARDWSMKGFYLPTFNSITEEEIKFIASLF